VTLPIRVVLLDGATAPKRGTKGSAGLDLCALETTWVGDVPAMVRTGVHVAIPEGWVGLVCIRSSVATKRRLSLVNSVAVIDSDYTGEILLALASSAGPQKVQAGERIAQLVVVPCFADGIAVVDALEPTDRGAFGFGSTGQ